MKHENINKQIGEKITEYLGKNQDVIETRINTIIDSTTSSMLRDRFGSF